jgi:hypothetical protein
MISLLVPTDTCRLCSRNTDRQLVPGEGSLLVITRQAPHIVLLPAACCIAAQIASGAAVRTHAYNPPAAVVVCVVEGKVVPLQLAQQVRLHVSAGRLQRPVPAKEEAVNANVV